MFKKKVVLVTGSTRGIGKEIGETFLREGAIVIFNGRKPNEEFKINNAYYYQADVANYIEVENMVNFIINKFGRLDILINNAGVNKDTTLKNMEENTWSSVVNTNLNSVYNCCKLTIPHMLENKFGRIINISSVVGIIGNFGQTNYAATKAGIIGFSKSLAQEVATKNITVNCIAPGFIQTDMLKDIPLNVLEKTIDKIPMKRLGKTQDISNAVLFLADEKNSYITGQTLSINGGLYFS